LIHWLNKIITNTLSTYIKIAQGGCIHSREQIQSPSLLQMPKETKFYDILGVAADATHVSLPINQTSFCLHPNKIIIKISFHRPPHLLSQLDHTHIQYRPRSKKHIISKPNVFIQIKIPMMPKQQPNSKNSALPTKSSQIQMQELNTTNTARQGSATLLNLIPPCCSMSCLDLMPLKNSLEPWKWHLLQV
jgi:hypothetical protein